MKNDKPKIDFYVINQKTKLPLKHLQSSIQNSSLELKGIIQYSDEQLISAIMEKYIHSVYICGPSGTGKTWLATYLGCNLFLEESRRAITLKNIVQFLQSSSLVRIFNLDQFGKEDEISYNEIKNTKFLILDDISIFSPMFKNRDYYFVMFDDLIRYRYSNLLPTILTSNIKPKDLVNELGPSLSSIILSKKESKTFILKSCNYRIE